MIGKSILIWGMCIALALPMFGCAEDYGQYAQAVKEQNITRQLRMETATREREYQQRRHEEKMTKLTGDLVIAAGKTASPNDDMMVPMLVMMMEDKWAMANMAVRANEPREQMATIKAPDSIGDTIQKSTSLLLGAGAIYLGIRQSDNMESIATAGIAAAGTHNTVSGSGNSITNDSYKSGSNNVVNGDTISSDIIGGDVACADCEKEDEVEEIEWTEDDPNCSVTSREAGRC